MLSLVIPVYRNEGSIDDLLSAVGDLNRRLGTAFEAVFVVDGSPDACYSLLRTKLPACSFRSQLVLLSRNFGSFTAIRTGLQYARGTRVARIPSFRGCSLKCIGGSTKNLSCPRSPLAA
jgi:glycosyltransferase involved in cell wall biosynthesis